MSKEIIEAVVVLEREKGIDGEILLTALEDALLAAYKKTPNAATHAKVELDRETGDIRVIALTLPEEVLANHPGVTMPEPVEPPEPADGDRGARADHRLVDVRRRRHRHHRCHA
jgi:transcription termination/antitermination protein NusA